MEFEKEFLYLLSLFIQFGHFKVVKLLNMVIINVIKISPSNLSILSLSNLSTLDLHRAKLNVHVFGSIKRIRCVRVRRVAHVEGLDLKNSEE